MKITREELLRQLESVTPGLSTREIIEQSRCFVFKNKKVATYNDEVACFQDCSLDIEGAIQSDRLLALLRKLPVTTVSIEIKDNLFQIRAKGHRKAELPIESEIALPIDSVTPPNNWVSLPSDFIEGISLVQKCVGKDETQFHLTCVHLHPNHVEACDNFQAARFTTKTGLDKPILVRKDSLQHVIAMGMTHFGITKDWIHFKNANGLMLSCRLYVEEYPDLSEIFDVKGIRTKLPKGLEQAVECASIFSNADADENHITIDLHPGEVKVIGQSISGRYSERQKIEYEKDPIVFTITPTLLLQILAEYNECVLSRKKKRLKAGIGSKFTYVTMLGMTKQKKENTNGTNTSNT